MASRLRLILLIPLVTVALAAGFTGSASAAPSNDNFASSQTLNGALPITVTGNDIGATAEAGEPMVNSIPPMRSVWYSWTAPDTKTYVLDTSVLLSDPTSFNRFEEHEVIVPVVVLTELEAKRNHPELGWAARQALRSLEALRTRYGTLTQPLPVNDRGGTFRVELNPVKSFVGRVSVPASGSYTLRVQGANGSSVEFPFSPQALDHHVKVKHFSLIIPNDGALQSLVVLQGSKTLTRIDAAAAATASTDGRRTIQAAPAPASVQAQNGQVVLSWNAVRHPYASLVWVGANGQRVVLAQDLRSGQAVVPAADLPAGGQFELILSDGLNTVRQQFAR